MGAKISKRGSYSLSKREKKKKKSKISNLEERTPSVICLSQAQIYDDVVKSPDLSTAHKIPERVNAADSNKTGTEPGPSVYSKPSSEYEIYSSIEELYANVQTGHGSENEEQMERRVSGAKDTSQAQETKPRKTWERPQYGNDEEFFDVLEDISDISSSEAGEMTDENPPNVNTGKWNGVFKDEFWSDKTQNMEVEVDYEEIDKIIKEKEEQLEIARQHEENTKGKLEEHIVLSKTTEEDIYVNNTYVNAINGTELLEKNTDEEQIPIIDAMNNQLVETYNQTNVTDDQTHLSKTENSNEENEWVLLDPDNKNKINENVLYDKNSHIIPADSIEKLRDLLQEQQNAKIDSSNNLQEIAEDEEEASEQVEIDKRTKTSNMYIKQPQKVTFETRKSPEDQMEVEQANNKHRTLSKSSSVNSDMFYELADEGSEQEETENEDQDLFYDAEGYDNAADIQVEVKNENIALSNKVEMVGQVNAKENQIQIPNTIPQSNQGESFSAVETTKNKIVVEEGFLHPVGNNSGTTSESHTEGVGILIDLDEDLQKPPVQEASVITSSTDNSEQIEFVELEGTVNDGVLLPLNIEDQKKPVPLELNAAIIEQGKLIAQNADRNNSDTTIESDTEDVGILIDPDEDLQKRPVQEKTVITSPTDNSEQIELIELESTVNNGVLLNIEDQKKSDPLEQKAAIIEQGKLIEAPVFFEDSNAFEEVSANSAINLRRRLSDNNVADISEDINPAVGISGNSLKFVPKKNQFGQNISMEILKKDNLAKNSNVQGFSEEPSQMHNASRPSTPNLTESSTGLYENEINLEESLNGELVSNKEETFIYFADAKEHSASTIPFLNVHENVVNSSKSSTEEVVGNVVSLEPTNLPIITIDEDEEASKKALFTETEAVAEKANESSPTIELAKADTKDVTTNSLENAAVEDSYSIFKPMTLSLLSNYQPITEDSSENEFKVPSAINSPEEIAEEQMRQWGQQKQVENEIIVSEINAIMVNIGSLKVKIENLGSTEKDREIHAAMYQEVIKIMREVNGINNHNFNEKILEMQRSALNQIHECLRELSLRRFN